MPENNMSNGFTPLLSTHDWNEEWKELQKARRRVDNVSFWDKRSETYTTKDAPNPYVERFLELADIHAQETVFDMGCGTGALSVPLGARGHKVVAGDFSQGMLDKMQERLNEQGIKTVFPKRMSWEDNWESLGVREDMVDVCIASRSMATADLKDSLMRLTNVARRRACITVATGSSPRTDERILNAIGLQSLLGRDYLYAFNILSSAGLKPEISYIESERNETYGTFEEAYDTFKRMTEDATRAFVPEAKLEAGLVRLHSWLKDNLVENEHVGTLDKKGVPEKSLRLSEPRRITWAFLAWNKED